MSETRSGLNSDRRLDLEQAAQHILDGGLVAYPTETFLGLGTNALDARAVEALRTVKRRGAKPISVIIASPEMLVDVVAPLTETADALGRAFWPGPLTLVMRATVKVPTELRAGGPTIGVRVSGHPIARALSVRIGGPLTSTSCNPAGQREPTRPDQIDPQVMQAISGFIDGRAPGGRASTIVDVSGDTPELLRDGAIPLRRLLEVAPDITPLKR